MKTQGQATVENLRIGTYVRQLRLSLPATQTEFGERYGVSQPAVAMWESGVADPPGEVMLAVIDYIQWVQAK